MQVLMHDSMVCPMSNPAGMPDTPRPRATVDWCVKLFSCESLSFCPLTSKIFGFDLDKILKETYQKN